MVEAYVVNQRRRGPGQLAGLSLGDASSVLDFLTSGQYTQTTSQLDRLEVLLKVSIAASVVAGIAGLAVLVTSRR